jgi:hypothetical protein
MDASDDSGLYFIDPSGWPGAEEYRATLARQRAESRRRYTEYLATVMIGCDDVIDPSERAAIVLDALTVWRRDGSEDPCGCSCHPRLPDSDFHDYGFGCVCMMSPEERRNSMAEWLSGLREFWESPDGQRSEAARDAEEAELQAWLAAHPEVTITSHGGLAPEQWKGAVDGHSFYFRERHSDWRIELDLRPSGRFVKRWVSGDLDDESSFELVETSEGDVIAEGTTRVHGYGDSPVERVQFIVDTIRNHLAPLQCGLHTGPAVADLAALLGDGLRWCPSCGARLH